MSKEDLNKLIDDILLALSGGFGLSGFGAMILPEVIHAIFVISTGLVGTVLIFFTNRFLKKRYP